jgi:hypothetical protein
MLNITSTLSAFVNNANKLGLPILPNKAKTKPERSKLLKKFELEKALEKGWDPTIPAIVV